MFIFISRLIPLLFALFFMATSAFASLQMPTIFSDHMMLQAELPVRVWGTTGSETKVVVSFGHITHTCQADSNGNWELWLPPQPQGASGDLIVTSNEEQRTIDDVLFGEVWFASGQSNMERSLHYSQDRDKVAARAQKAGFRFFIVQHSVTDAPAQDVRGHWEIANTKNVDNFSATACSFSIELAERLHRPVGIIDSTFGGTRLQAWTSSSALRLDPRLKFVAQGWDKALADLPDRQTKYKSDLSNWAASLGVEDKAKADRGIALPGKPSEPLGAGSKLEPSGLYNGMVAPLTRFSVRGILWYQGENDALDATSAFEYRDLFQAMIQSWREAWGDKTMPFLFVQLSRYRGPTYPLLRESQAQALALSHTAMIVSADQGTSEDVHYPNKEIVGMRLERAAEQLAYDKPGAYVPIQAIRLTQEGSELRVWFSPGNAKLVVNAAPIPYFAAGSQSSNVPRVIDGRSILQRQPTPAELRETFQIAGDDGVFFPAAYRLEGSTVIVFTPKVKQPTQLCYAWSDAAPVILLWSAEGLPVSPFRLAAQPGTDPSCAASNILETDGGFSRK